MSSSSITACVQNQICILEHPLTLANGTVLPAGSKILILPTTTASCVLVDGNDKSLEETLGDINATSTSFETSLAGFQGQLTRYAGRLSALEIWAAQQGFVPTDNASES